MLVYHLRRNQRGNQNWSHNTVWRKLEVKTKLSEVESEASIWISSLNMKLRKECYYCFWFWFHYRYFNFHLLSDRDRDRDRTGPEENWKVLILPTLISLSLCFSVFTTMGLWLRFWFCLRFQCKWKPAYKQREKEEEERREEKRREEKRREEKRREEKRREEKRREEKRREEKRREEVEIHTIF